MEMGGLREQKKKGKCKAGEAGGRSGQEESGGVRGSEQEPEPAGRALRLSHPEGLSAPSLSSSPHPARGLLEQRRPGPRPGSSGPYDPGG